MLTQHLYHRLYRVSAWYDLAVTWPFATPLTLWLYWEGVMQPLSAASGLPALPALDPHAVLFANFFGTVVLIWSVVRLKLNDVRLALYDGIGRAAFSAWMIYALSQGVTPLVWVFLLPELGFAILQLAPPRSAVKPALPPFILAKILSPKAKRGPKGPRLFLCLRSLDQFGIKSGRMVTITGKNHNNASPTTWISTNGATPR